MANENFVSWIFSKAAEHDQHSPVLFDAFQKRHSNSLSTEEIINQTKQVIAGLQAIGIRPGDCVCLDGFNSVQYHILFLGIIGAGAVFTGLNPSYSPTEIVHHLELTKVKAAIVEPSKLKTFLVAADEIKFDRSKIFSLIDGHDHDSHSGIGLQSWRTLIGHGLAEAVEVPNENNTVAVYASTSGTTGLPKAAKLSHAYLRRQAAMQISPRNISYKVRRLLGVPPFHVFCMPIVAASIAQGCPVYIMTRLDIPSLVAAISQHQITETYLPPPVITGLPKSPFGSRGALASLRQIWIGGAAVTYQNQLPMYNLLREDAQINMVWGMTEIGWAADSRWGHKQFNDSCGTMNEGYEIQIVRPDEMGMGEILVHSPAPFLGYVDNEEATSTAFTDDGHWLYTGDLGYVKNDCVYIVDRKKELIKVRAWQVSPVEVEMTLLQHPGVADVAVIGIPCLESTGAGDEFVRAYIVRNNSSPEITEQDLRTFAAKSLAKYKLPKEYVFVLGIPKNATGKILRRLLREEARNMERFASAQSITTCSDIKPVQISDEKRTHTHLRILCKVEGKLRLRARFGRLNCFR